MSRLAGINMHPNQILIFQARRYTFKPWVQGEQVVTLVPIFHPNDLVIRPRPVEVPMGNILGSYPTGAHRGRSDGYPTPRARPRHILRRIF